MGRWKYDWEVLWYGRGSILHRKIISAKTRADALKELHKTEEVIEVYRCVRIDRW